MERELVIEALVYGGDGLARLDGRVVFVPLVAPGDRVRVELGDDLRARLLEVITPGPDRIVPPCPLVGTCGGCDWQQVSIEGQRVQKHRSVVEALERLGRLDAPPVAPLVASPRTDRYRRRLRAHPVKDHWGFSIRGTPKVVPVPTCLLVEEEVERLASGVVQAWKKQKLPRLVSFAVDADEAGGGVGHFDFVERVTPMVKGAASRVLSLVKGLRGLVLTGPGDKPQTVGNPVVVDQAHHGLRVRSDLFAQANRLGARLLAQHVADSVAPGASVLELFCGAGTLTLPVSTKAGALVAVEGDGPAIELLKLSLAEGGRMASVETGRADAVASRLIDAGRRFDHVVLDPPRAGARECVAPILRSGAARLTYVSCDPATFARDAAQLVAGGFRLQEVVPFDLFPHTHHVELVARFER